VTESVPPDDMVNPAGQPLADLCERLAERAPVAEKRSGYKKRPQAASGKPGGAMDEN